MDFNSLAVGSPFYLLRKNGKPTLLTGVVKSMSAPQPRYQPQAIANAFAGQQVQQVVTVTATFDGRDETYSDIPINIEIAQSGTDTITGDREAMLQAVDAMIQTSKRALEAIDYHRAVCADGEQMIETLNPRYAEEKRQARTITDLEKRQADTDKKLDNILSILQKLDAPTK